jgi:hypothetical protein
VVTAKFLMTVKELLARRFHYRGQLRRHRNRQRNADLADFWNARVVADVKAGYTQKAARASATEAASKKFGISASQVGRARADAATYLMGAAELKRSIRELQQFAGDQKRFLVHAKRFRRYQDRFRSWVLQGKPTAYAHMHAINDVADEWVILDNIKHPPISPGQMRRILRLFDVPTRR